MNREELIALKSNVEAGERGDGLNTSSVFGAPSDMDAVEAFDGSLDAARALHDVVLPGWGWVINGFRSWAQVWAEGDRSSNASFEAVCPNNPARAWLLAILSALIAMEPET